MVETASAGSTSTSMVSPEGMFTLIEILLKDALIIDPS
jgi:hypothetical protein